MMEAPHASDAVTRTMPFKSSMTVHTLFEIGASITSLARTVFWQFRRLMQLLQPDLAAVRIRRLRSSRSA